MKTTNYRIYTNNNIIIPLFLQCFATSKRLVDGQDGQNLNPVRRVPRWTDGETKAQKD